MVFIDVIENCMCMQWSDLCSQHNYVSGENPTGHELTGYKPTTPVGVPDWSWKCDDTVSVRL